MTIDELVGENVRRARASVGLSASELAHRVTGVGLPLTESALLRLEAGEDRLGVDELIAFGLALGMPPALLLAPLNLGSLLWVDAEGRPMASWALFHDNARSFHPPQQEAADAGAGRVLGAAPASAGPANEPPPPPPPPPPLAVDEPVAVSAPILPAAEAAAPSVLRSTPAEAEDPAPLAAEDGPAEGPTVLPPDPAPSRKPIAGLGEETGRSPHRDWALEALQSLQTPSRDA